MWRATKLGLQRRGVELNVRCVFCNKEEKSLEHMLWECENIRRIWAASDLGIQIGAFLPFAKYPG